MTVVKETIKAKNGVLHMNLPDEFWSERIRSYVHLENRDSLQLAAGSFNYFVLFAHLRG